MDGYLRQSTASQTRTLGPFVDSTDFFTLENALTIANTDILLKKNGGASAAKNSGGATADGAGGLYAATWDATDTSAVGQLTYSIKVAGALVVFGSYTVLEEAVYDALFAASAAGYATAAAVAAVQADTDDLQTRLPAALTAGGNIRTDTLYMMGRVWIDTVTGVAGTTAYVHGIVTNPNASLANARTIANALNLTAFEFRNGSVVTLDQGYVGFTFLGEKWTLALANRAITNSFFMGADISGLSTGTGARFLQCVIQTATISDASIFSRCGLNGTFTCGAAGQYVFESCFSATAAGTDTIIDFAALGATTVGLRNWSGGVEIRNMAAGDVLRIAGRGRVTVAASCTAGVIGIEGAFVLTNSGTATISDSARWAEDQNITNVTGSVAALGTDAVNAAAVSTDAVAEIQSGLATSASITTLTTKVDTIDDLLDTEVAAILAKVTPLPADPADASDIASAFGGVNTKLDTIIATGGGSGLDAAGVRAALGMSSANLDSQLTAIDDAVDTEVAAIKAKTDLLPADPADASDIAASFATVSATLATIASYIDTEVAAIKAKTDLLPTDPADQSATEAAIAASLTTAVADSVPADGSRPSIAQALYMIVQILTEKTVLGTTMTIKKPDGSSSLMTLTINDATSPTSITRAS